MEATPSFDVFIRNYDDGKPLITLTVKGTMTIASLKKTFAELCKCILLTTYDCLDSEVFYPEKQLYWQGGIALKRDYMTLNDYDVKPGDTLYVQDRGTQVSYRLAQILINIGPVISFTMFWAYRLEIYSFCLGENNVGDEEYLVNFKPTLAQDVAIKMALCHFMKRILECTFVHFYSKPTKSLSNLVLELGYFWLFFGTVVPFYLFHPHY